MNSNLLMVRSDCQMQPFQIHLVFVRYLLDINIIEICVYYVQVSNSTRNIKICKEW